jgi:hypothetical protein
MSQFQQMTRRKLLGTVTVGAHALLLSCGGDEEDDRLPRDEPESQSGTASEPVSETVALRLAVLDSPYTVTPGQKAVQAWSNGSVTGASPEITLELVKVPMEDGARGFLASRATAGVPVDCMWLPHWQDIPDLFKSGLLAPLDRWLQVDQAKPLEAFAAEARSLVRLRGQTLALPIAIAPVVLAHNASRFKNLGLATPTSAWQWIDFIEAGKSLTEDINGDGSQDRWGFMPLGQFPEWLVFMLQEGDPVVDLDTGKVGLDGPASMRGLSAWDELGRVHGIMPYGPEVTAAKFQGYYDYLQRGLHFSYSFNSLPERWRSVTPLPTGSSSATPLALTEALAIPEGAQGDRTYEALVSLAHWIGERRVMPATTAGWEFIKRPDREHFNLVFPEDTQDTLLHALNNAKASHLASSPGLSQALFNLVTYRLARGEVGIEQAIEQAREWLQNYVNE